MALIQYFDDEGSHEWLTWNRQIALFLEQVLPK